MYEMVTSRHHILDIFDIDNESDWQETKTNFSRFFTKGELWRKEFDYVKLFMGKLRHKSF